MKKTLLTLAALLVAAMSFAQTDFSGSWKLNPSKSKMEERNFAPQKIVVTQDGNNLKVESSYSMPENSFTTTDQYTLDGQECVNPGMMDSQKKSKATWSEDKKTLTMASTVNFQDQTMTINETYRLESGTLLIEVKVSSSYGEVKELRAFDKE